MSILVSFEPRKHMFLGSTKHIVDFMDLIQLILTRKQWEQRENLKKHATNAPDIHLIVVVPLC